MTKINYLNSIIDKEEIVAQYSSDFGVMFPNNNNLPIITKIWDNLDFEAYTKIIQKYVNKESFSSPQLTNALEICHELNSYLEIFQDLKISYNIFLAGGAVRDIIAHKPVKDLDFFISIYNNSINLKDILKSETYHKYAPMFPNNPFVQFVNHKHKTLKEDSLTGGKIDLEYNIVDLPCFEQKQPIESKNLINHFQPIQSYVENPKWYQHSTVNVYALLISFISNILIIKNVKNQNFIQGFSESATISNKEQSSYSSFMTKQLSGVIKIENPLINYDIIFLEKGLEPLETFDWEICKASILMYSYKKDVIYKNDSLIDIFRSSTLEELNSIDELKYKKSGFHITKVTDNDSIFITYEKKIPEKNTELISRFLGYCSFFESLEKKLLIYNIKIEPIQHLIYHINDRKNKLLSKYSDYTIEYRKLVELEKLFKISNPEDANNVIKPLIDIIEAENMKISMLRDTSNMITNQTVKKKPLKF